MHVRRLIAAAVVVAGSALPVREARAQFGGAVFCTNCGSEWTQLAMAARQIVALEQEVKTAVANLQTAATVVRNAANITEHPLTSITNDLELLSRVMGQSQGLAGGLAANDAAFRAAYQPYSPYNALENFSGAYDRWNKMTLNTLQGSVKAAGYQNEMLTNEQGQFVAKFNAMSKRDLGTNESIQLGTAVASAELSQLEALRQLMITDMEAKAAFMAGQIQKDAAVQAATRNGFGYAQPVTTGKVW